MNKNEANYYIVRIYRRQGNIDPTSADLIGLVETPGGARQAKSDFNQASAQPIALVQ